jgi:ABC-type phosphate transport system permease subunit
VLFAAGLVLLVIGIAVNSVARWLVWSAAGSDVGAATR